MKKSEIVVGQIFSNNKRYEGYRERKVISLVGCNVYYDEALYYTIPNGEGAFETNKRNQLTSLISFQKWAKIKVNESKFEWEYF